MCFMEYKLCRRKCNFCTIKRKLVAFACTFVQKLTHSTSRPQSTYICRVQSCVWRLPKYWPPTPSPPSECVLPPHQGGGYTLAVRCKGGGKSIFLKTPEIGLASYKVISLRSRLTENIPVSDPIVKHPWVPTLPNCRVKYGSRAQIVRSYGAGVISVSNSPVSGFGIISTCLDVLSSAIQITTQLPPAISP
jgi:hypothetical protein